MNVLSYCEMASYGISESLQHSKIELPEDPIPTKRASWPDKSKKQTTPQVQSTYSVVPVGGQPRRVRGDISGNIRPLKSKGTSVQASSSSYPSRRGGNRK
jgi:hypothetical protein